MVPCSTAAGAAWLSVAEGEDGRVLLHCHAGCALTKVGLVVPRTPVPTAPTLGEWLTKYIGQRKAELKPSSVTKLERTAHFLREHFGAGTHVRNVKQLFGNAVRRKLIGANPFTDLVGPVKSAERDRYVTPAETEPILKHCHELSWRVLVGLARHTGLRVPSETHLLAWGDTRWDSCRMVVRSPKSLS